MQNNKWYKDDTEKYVILKNSVGRNMCVLLDNSLKKELARISFVIDELCNEYLVFSDTSYNKDYIGFYMPDTIKVCTHILYDREYDFFNEFNIDRFNRIIRKLRGR